MSRRSSRKSAIPSYAESTSDKDIENGGIEVDHDDDDEEVVKSSPTKKRQGKSVVKKEEEESSVKGEGGGAGKGIVKSKAAVDKRKKAHTEVKETAEVNTVAKRKAEDEDDEEEEVKEVTQQSEKKVAKKRKTKEEKEKDTMPLAVRTAVATLKRKMYIGAHISSAGGVQNSISNALHIGSNAFALFLKSQRKWSSPPLATESKYQFHALAKQHAYDPALHILPHGSYLVNLAQPDPEKAQQAYTCFLDDLSRCESLGIKLYNFHPGNTNGAPRHEAIARIAAQLNRAHDATTSVVTVLENMAGAGNVIGAQFEDLRDIIALVRDKARVGVCIDTCHAFAAGYDLRSASAFAATMKTFDDVVGKKYLRALHLNDSKTPLGSRRDLHANIGTGFLGLRAFWNVVNCEAMEGLPMVLETPIERKGEGGKVVEDRGVWAGEIKLLEKMVGCDFEEESWRGEEERLQEEGRVEREKFEKQVDKKKQKTLDDMLKKGKKGKGGAKKKKDEQVETDDESDGGCNH